MSQLSKFTKIRAIEKQVGSSMFGKEYKWFIKINKGLLPWEYDSKEKVVKDFAKALLYSQQYDRDKMGIEKV